MQNLSTFKFNNDTPIRVVTKDNEAWFIAADVCKALNLDNPTKAIRSLDDDEKALTLIQGLNRGNEPVNIINESGMYTLVLRCRDAVKPGTLPHRFRKWVTSEVLPSIRKTGSYSTDDFRQFTTSEQQQLEGYLSNLFFSRFLLSFDENRNPHLHMLSQDACAVSVEKWPDVIKESGLFSQGLLLRILQACASRLKTA